MFKENSKLKSIFLGGFLFSLHLAFTAYINSSLIANVIGEKNIALVYATASILAILALLFIPKFFSKIGSRKFLIITSTTSALLLLLLSFFRDSLALIPIFIVYLALNTLIIFTIDELLKIYSQSNSTGKIRGFYLTVTSLAWVLAQISSGEILSTLNIGDIYVLASVLVSLFLINAIFKLNKIEEPNYDKSSTRENIKKFFFNKNLRNAYFINITLQFFYSWMVIYTPIYLRNHMYLPWEQIGIVFAIMLLPFVLIQFPMGKYADLHGEKKMLKLGFLISAIFTFLIFFIQTNNILVWALVLFMTRVGAATIEVMADVHFFKNIKPENEEYIGIYRSAAPIAYTIGPITAFIVFLLIPEFKFIYLVLSCVMIFGIYLASKIKNV
jgi:MFS family permease